MQLETIITLAILGVVALSGVIAIIVAIARGEVKAFIKEKMAEAEQLYKDVPKPQKSTAKLQYVLDAVDEKYKVSKLFLNIRKFIEEAVKFHNTMNGNK